MKKTLMKPILSDSFTFEIVEDKGVKRAKIIATDYYQHFLKTKCKIGDKGTMFLTLKKPTRSESQLRYYWVVVGLLANDCGYTSEELHEWLMISCFGTQKVTVNGITKEVRKSIAKSARISKLDMMTLLDFALEKCFEMNVIVPSAQSLGYIRN